MSKNADEQQAPVLLWIPPHRFRPRGVVEVLLASLLVIVLFFVACDGGGPKDRYLGVYEVEVNEERFFIALDNETQVEQAEARLADSVEAVIHGTLVRGDGGFNEPYGWHLDPVTVTFPDMAMEVCDGRPQSEVEDHLEYWFESVGYYCPWGARVLRRVE